MVFFNSEDCNILEASKVDLNYAFVPWVENYCHSKHDFSLQLTIHSLEESMVYENHP